jgi:FKBP-type peptidyl-prolyl cis-trans isomerase SlyD
MKIDLDTVATVTYTLSIDGEHVETADKSNPLVFLVGADAMIPGFEGQLIGKSIGDSYDISVGPEDGYGETDPEAIIDLGKEAFMIDGVVQEDLLVAGNIINMKDQHGHPLEGLILEVNDESVKLDFNHQLAGKTLHFKGEIVDVRPATDDEIAHGHVHGPGGVEH